MTIKLKDSITLINTNPFYNDDGTMYLELREGPNFAKKSVGTFNGTYSSNTGEHTLSLTVYFNDKEWINPLPITKYHIENGKIIVSRKDVSKAEHTEIIDGSENILPNGVYSNAEYGSRYSSNYPYSTEGNIATTITITDDLYIIDFIDEYGVQIRQYDGTYDFNIDYDGYYGLFSYDKKIAKTEYIDGKTITTYELGEIVRETLDSGEYIDLQTTSPVLDNPKLLRVLCYFNQETGKFSYKVLRNDLCVIKDIIFEGNKRVVISVDTDIPDNKFYDNKTEIYSSTALYGGNQDLEKFIIKLINGSQDVLMYDVSKLESDDAYGYNWSGVLEFQVYKK